MKTKALTETSLLKAVKELSGRDEDLGLITKKLGPPPMWSRQPGFLTLIHIILEQQVSLASAKSAFDKLIKDNPDLTPQLFLKINDDRLKAYGFSRQKSRYCRNAAIAIMEKSLNLSSLQEMDDNDGREELEKIVGIGPWTSGIYLLMALKRPDIWPPGDLALISAITKVKSLQTRPDNSLAAEIAEQWHPWRAVAARMLWHFYLNIS